MSIQLKTLQDMTGDSLLMNNTDREKLSSLFPEIDLKPIMEINEFQKQLSQNVNQEIENEKKELSDKIGKIQKRIDEINHDLLENNISPRIPKTFMDAVYNKRSEIKNLENQIATYEMTKSIKEKVKNFSKQMNDNLGYVLTEIEKSINSKLEKLNDSIYLEKRISPTISIPDFNHYTYRTPKDTGTGTNYKSLILFDLAILELTSLPFIINDSMLFKNIWDEPLEGLFRLYNKFEKQIFIAIDRINVFSAEMQQIIKEHEVVKLGNDDKVLFGFTWSKKTPEEK